MLNLLNVVATLFTGTAYHVPEGYSKAQIDIGYDFTVNQYSYDGVEHVLFEFELTPFVDLTSIYFENGANLDDARLDPLLLEFELDNTYISEFDSVSFNIDIYNIYITCFTEPTSTINFYFDYTINLAIFYNDDNSVTDTFDAYYELDYYPNLTILSTFDFIDEAYIYQFNASCNIDLGYNAGYDEGKSVGYDDGVDFGYHDGYDDGYDEGYKEGYKDIDKAFNGSWVDWLGTAVTGFFALEIFPGFTLAGALGAVLCAYIMMWILKVLAGG